MSKDKKPDLSIYGALKEKGNAWENLYKKEIRQSAQNAEARGKSLGVKNPNNGHNDDLDAFRHTFVSAQITRDKGGLFAAAAGMFRAVTGFTLSRPEI
jgi:hypothetical protein